MKILTIAQLKELIKNIPDDFELKMKLQSSHFNCPFEYFNTELEFDDIGYSDKIVIFSCKNTEE